jgi:hypothetical protein
MLNDDVLDDMETSVIDHDLIKGPSSVTVSNPIIVNTGDSNKESVGKDIENIGKAEIQFNVIDGGTIKLIDMQAVYDEISTEQLISKSDVAYSLEHFPNLLSKRLSLEQYSQAKSKINYEITTRLMRQAIATEQNLLFENTQLFFKEPVDAVTAVLNKLESTYLQTLFNNCRDITDTAKIISGKLEGSRHTVVKYKDDFKSFLEIPLRDLDSTMFIDGDMDKSLFSTTVKNIEKIYDCKNLRICLSAVVYGKDTKSLFSSNRTREETISDINCKDILIFYTSDGFSAMLNNLETYAGELKQGLEFLKNSSKVDTATQEELFNFLVANNLTIVEIIRQSSSLTNLVFSLSQLNFNIGIFFNQLQKA